MTILLQSIRRAGLRFGLCLLVPPLLATLAAAQPLPGDPLPPLTGALPAQTAQTAQTAQEVPGRVARLADSSGQVWLFSPNSGPDSGEWISPPRNQPLTSGDRLVTDPGARAELRIGSTRLRLDGGGELELTRLDDEHLTLRLYAGSLAVRLRTAEAAHEFELTSAEGRFTALQPGRYRIDRTPADPRRGSREGVDSSALTVYEGQAYYQGPGSALTVYPNQRADFRFDAGGRAQYAITEAAADGFARWSGERDRDDDRVASAAARYVSPEMTGIEDLDRNGRWEQDADYGALWIPSAVAVDWAPYSAGRWAWVRPWGWTWVDDAPWGFAPFHYGRWLWRGNRWCWAPGQYVQRPVYAPALVVWLRGAGDGGRPGRPDRPGDRPHDGRRPDPSIGWFPLGPREPFVPSYRASPRQARELNGGDVGRPGGDDRRDGRPPRGAMVGGVPAADDFRNRHAPHALTALPESALLQRPPGGVPTAAWRNTASGRDDARRDGRTDGRGVGGERRGGEAEPAAALNTIAAPPAPLRLTVPVSPAQRSQGDRADGAAVPGGPRATAVDAAGVAGPAGAAGPGLVGAGREDAFRRLPPPAGPQRPFAPVAPLVQTAPAAVGALSAPAAPLMPTARSPAAPAAPPPDRPLPAAAGLAAPTPPAAPLPAGRVPMPGEPRFEGRQPNGTARRGADEPQEGRRDDRRGERRDFPRDSGREGDPMSRREERRPFTGGPTSTVPGLQTAPAAFPPPMPAPAPLRTPAPPVAAPPLTAPPAQQAPPAFAAPQRPVHEAPTRPAAAVAQPAAPAALPAREAPAAPRMSPPAGEPPTEALRRALPVNRPPADERRGPPPGNGPQRER